MNSETIHTNIFQQPTKEELQFKIENANFEYSQLCAQLGDAVYKLHHAGAEVQRLGTVVQDIQSQLDAFTGEIDFAKQMLRDIERLDTNERS